MTDQAERFALVCGSMQLADVSGSRAPAGFTRYVLAAAFDAKAAECERLREQVTTLKDMHESASSSLLNARARLAELEAPAQSLAVPEECPHMIVFDDADRMPLMFAGAGAREAALKTWKKISVSWNAHLFVRVERNSRDDKHPSAQLTEAERTVVLPPMVEFEDFVTDLFARDADARQNCSRGWLLAAWKNALDRVCRIHATQEGENQ